ncbi:MAG: hypothetical protein V1735_05115 [Nanoarchaeota archaeon]
MYSSPIRPIRVIGTGRADAQYQVPNTHLERIVALNTTADWIKNTIGVETRGWIGPHQNLYVLAAVAAEKALADAGKTLDDVSHVYVAHNVSGEYTEPPASALVSHLLGIEGKPALDVIMGCSGFVNAVEVGRDNLQHQEIENFARFGPEYRSLLSKVNLVLATDTMSYYPLANDRTFRVMSSDGAAAFVLSAEDSEAPEILFIDTATYGGKGHHILMPTGLVNPFRYREGEFPVPETLDHIPRPYFIMKGNDVHPFIVRTLRDRMPLVIVEANKILEERGLPLITPNNFQVVPHQPNKPGLLSAAKQYKGFVKSADDDLVTDFIYTHGVERRGNNSGASAPIAYDMAREDGWLRHDTYHGIVVMGAGLSDGFIFLSGNLQEPRRVLNSDEELSEKYWDRWTAFLVRAAETRAWHEKEKIKQELAKST